MPMPNQRCLLLESTALCLESTPSCEHLTSGVAKANVMTPSTTTETTNGGTCLNRLESARRPTLAPPIWLLSFPFPASCPLGRTLSRLVATCHCLAPPPPPLLSVPGRTPASSQNKKMAACHLRQAPGSLDFSPLIIPQLITPTHVSSLSVARGRNTGTWYSLNRRQLNTLSTGGNSKIKD